MNRVSPRKILRTLLKGTLPLVVAFLSACSYLMPQPTPPPKPTRMQKPAAPSPSDTQQKERARQELQKATSSSNEYSACVMFATSTHRAKNVSASDVAAAASANCAPKLDDYEQGMAAYYESNPVKPSGPTASSPKERAHERRIELEQATRDAAIRSLGQAN